MAKFRASREYQAETNTAAATTTQPTTNATMPIMPTQQPLSGLRRLPAYDPDKLSLKALESPDGSWHDGHFLCLMHLYNGTPPECRASLHSMSKTWYGPTPFYTRPSSDDTTTEDTTTSPSLFSRIWSYLPNPFSIFRQENPVEVSPVLRELSTDVRAIFGLKIMNARADRFMLMGEAELAAMDYFLRACRIANSPTELSEERRQAIIHGADRDMPRRYLNFWDGVKLDHSGGRKDVKVEVELFSPHYVARRIMSLVLGADWEARGFMPRENANVG